MKRIIPISFSVFFAIIFTALSLELLTRIFLPMYNPSGMLRFRRVSNGMPLGVKNFNGRQWTNTGDYNVSVKINKYGFRDTKDLRDSAEKDVFVVGDSFAFGHGVEEEKRYSNVLETILDIPVYNIGINGADINDYEKLITYAEKNGATVKNVIISVSMENDLRNYNTPSRKRNARKHDYLAKKKKSDIPKNVRFKIKRWLARNTALYHALAGICYKNNILAKLAVKTGFIEKLIGGKYYRDRPENKYSEEVLESSTGKLAELAGCFNTTVVIIPSRSLWVGKNRNIERKVHEKFVKGLKKNGLNIIDLQPAFEKEGNPLQYHFKHDGHWNEKGHLKAAETIAESIDKY